MSTGQARNLIRQVWTWGGDWGWALHLEGQSTRNGARFRTRVKVRVCKQLEQISFLQFKAILAHFKRVDVKLPCIRF